MANINFLDGAGASKFAKSTGLGTDADPFVPAKSIDSALPAGTNNIGDVDLASAIPAGTNNIGDVDLASPLEDADTGAGVRNAVPVILVKKAAAAPDFGTATDPLKVDVQSALPVGTNNIGDVDLASAIPPGTNNIGDVDVLTLPALAAGTNNIGDVDVLTLPPLVAGAANIGDVDVVSMPTGASAAQVQGDVAHDGVNSGNPVQIGVEAIAHGTNPTAVAAGDRTKLYANRAGVQFVIGGHPNIQTFRTNWTALQTDVALVTAAAGEKIVLTSIAAMIDEAVTVGVTVRVGFGATATPTGAGVVLAHGGLVPGGGITRGDGSGILGVGADGDDLRLTADAPTSGSGDIFGTYYTVPS